MSQDIDLTDMEAIRYLLSNDDDNRQGREKVTVHIRTKEKCPECRKAFTEYSRVGFICKEHKRMPRKFYVEVFHEGNRDRFYKDTHGMALDSYKRAQGLYIDIVIDKKNGTYDRKKYKSEQREIYYLGTRWNIFKVDHQNPKYQKTIKVVENNYLYNIFRSTTDVRDITQTEINLFADAIMQQGKGIDTVKNYTSILLSCLNYCRSKGLTKNILTMPKFTEQQKKQNQSARSKSSRIPDVAETFKILSFIPPEHRDFYLFIPTHGCRPAEARALQAGDLDFANGTVKIQRGFSGNVLQDHTKTYEDEHSAEPIPIHPDMIERLRQRCISKNPSDFVFTIRGNRPYSEGSFFRIFKDAAREAGMEHVEPYKALKHAALSFMASASGDHHNVSKLARHSDEAMTRKYTKRADVDAIRRVQATLRIPADLIPKT